MITAIIIKLNESNNNGA